MNRTRLSFALNLLLAAMVAFATWAMLTGFTFMSRSAGDSAGRLAAGGLLAFRYFTTDSNVLLGLIALIFAGFEPALLRGSLQALPKWLYVLKLAGTAGVGLTMLVTVCWLAPIARGGYFSLFQDSNLFFHLVVPLLSIVCFMLLEPCSSLRVRDCLYGLIPAGCYAAYYLINILTHLENGAVAPGTDWYSFTVLGLWSIPLVVVLILGLVFGICLLLLLGNRRLGESRT